MLRLLRILIFLMITGCFFSSCTESGCDDCTFQKQEFCRNLMEVNCNSAFLTNNIDQLNKACGKDEAESFISTTTHDCAQGTLSCPLCE